MRILLTGGTGFIGRALCPRLAQAGHELVLLTRRPQLALPAGVSSAAASLEGLAAADFQAVINLAGEPIAGRRWSEARKHELIASRVGITGGLVDWMARSEWRPGVLVSASAVGYYGEQGERPVTEDSAPAPGFTHELCAAWEREASRARSLGVRVCLVRTGVVLDRDGGALAKMLPAFRLGLGGPLGSGQHYFPWIHREDMVSIYHWLIEHRDASGAYNASAPNPVSNAQFTAALAAALHRPALLPMPGWLLKALFGELAELLLVSDRMVPRRLLAEGFVFRYPDLGPALQAMFRSGSRA
jgi:uncharacterized protein